MIPQWTHCKRNIYIHLCILHEGCKKKRLLPQKLSHIYKHFTPIIGSEILSGFQIILQNFGETCSF